MKFSECYSFLSELINAEKTSIPLKIENASTIIPKNRIFFNAKKGIFEIRSASGKIKFGAMLSIKGYSPITYHGMLDEINLLKIEYVITQSFRFYDRHVAKVKLRDQQNEMLQSAEESQRQTEQIDVVFDDTASGELGYGAHHFTLTCYADTQEELDRNIGTIIARFTDIDITCVREDIAMECGFWAQLPGNFGYILRAADISTKNLASFASLHNYPKGKLTGNHWGNAVTVFETIAGSPYYFNFHYKDVGNFLVFGSMGSGKTLLIGFLILQSLKFSGKRIIFDIYVGSPSNSVTKCSSSTFSNDIVNSCNFFISSDLLIILVSYSAIIAGDRQRLMAYLTTSSSFVLQIKIPMLGFSCGFLISRSSTSK